MDNEFTIPLNGLAPGTNEFCRRVTGKFFEEFGNEDIKDAELTSRAAICKREGGFSVDVTALGTVTVLCDRCMEDLTLPVNVSAAIIVKFGQGDVEQQDGREVLYLPQEDSQVDLSQIIYDYVCLSLPMQKHHPDGQCNPEALKYLCGEVTTSQSVDNNPFASLKGLFEN